MLKELSFKWYCDGSAQVATCWNLVSIGAKHFKEAQIVMDIDGFSDACSLCGVEGSEDAYKKSMSKYMNGYLIDIIRISIFFENYAKAVLIKKGYLVHEIKRKDSTLRKIQKKGPVNVPHLFLTLASEGIPISQMSSYLDDRTIGISQLLNNSKYLAQIEIPESVSKWLKHMSKDRNRLHFMNYEEIGHGNETVSIFRSMIRFVEDAVEEFRPSSVMNKLLFS